MITVLEEVKEKGLVTSSSLPRPQVSNGKARQLVWRRGRSEAKNGLDHLKRSHLR